MPAYVDLILIPIFQGLSDEELKQLSAISVDQEVEKGQIIFSEGDEGVGFYIISRGKIKIYKLSPDGKEQILHLFGAGEPFGEVALFNGMNFPAYAEALEKSRVLFFPRKAFARAIKDNPSLAMNMLAALSMRLHKFAAMIEDLSLKEVPARLAAHVLLLSEQLEGADRIKLDVTKGQLASLLGTIPETLSRALTRMIKVGLIVTDGAYIEIRDRAGLRALAMVETRLSDLADA